MASDKPTPPPSRKTSFSTQSKQSIQPFNVEDAAVEPTPSVHQNEIELEDLSPPRVLPLSGKQKEVETTPPQQGGPNTASHARSNSGGDGAPQPPQEEENRRLLGIPAYQGHSYVDRSYDYMRKYPPDAPGKELDPDARVWKVYLDEAESYDNDMIKSFRDTIDSLLVFAALFSSAVTGFVVQTSQALQPDFAQIGASLLFEQIQVLRAAGNTTKIEEIPRSPLTPDSVTHSSLDVAINWLFFASLAFSLATAFIAILIKQWLQAFTALIPGDAKVQSLTRQFRFTGLQKWKLPEIINILPLFLHFALALFLIGLCLFVLHFHPSIAVMVIVVACAAIAFYIITGALPAVHLDCPYRLPILFILACLMIYAFKTIRLNIAYQLRKLRLRPHYYPDPPEESLSPLHSQEQKHVSDDFTAVELEGLSLAWLFTQTPNTSVQRVALHGVSCLVKRYPELDEDDALFLRNLLPLKSMNQTAVRFCTPEGQLEDCFLLLDVVLFSRQVCNGPFLSEEDIDDVLGSRYACALVEHDVLAHSQPDWDIRCRIFMEAMQKDKWDVVTYLLDSSLDRVWDCRINDCRVLAFASVSEAISHEDWVTIFSKAKQKAVNFNTFHFAEWTESTVLHLVSSYGTVAALRHLISHVPDLDFNVGDSYGSTPLHFACDRGKDYPERDKLNPPLRILSDFVRENGVNLQKPAPLITQALLLAQADPNIVDNKGWLPLHNACSNGFRNFGCSEEGLEVLDQLLVATKNINQRSDEGLTPLDLLEKSERKDTEEGKAGYSLMRKHGARLVDELPQIEGEGEDDSDKGGTDERSTDEGDTDDEGTDDEGDR